MTERVLKNRSVLLNHVNPLGAAFLVLGVAALIWGSVTWSIGGDLARDGLSTTGAVVSRYVRTDPKNGNRTYYISYRYTAADGQDHTSSARVSRAVHGRVRPGHSLQVRYLPQSPGISESQFEDRADSGWMTLIFGAISTAFGSGILLWQWPMLTAMLRAAKAPGEPARVTAQHPVKTYLDNTPLVTVAWQDQEGKGGVTGPVKAAIAPEIGAQIRLRRDPDTQRRWWEGELA